MLTMFCIKPTSICAWALHCMLDTTEYTMPKARPTIALSLRLDPALHSKLADKAARSHVSMNACIEAILLASVLDTNHSTNQAVQQSPFGQYPQPPEGFR